MQVILIEYDEVGVPIISHNKPVVLHCVGLLRQWWTGMVAGQCVV